MKYIVMMLIFINVYSQDQLSVEYGIDYVSPLFNTEDEDAGDMNLEAATKYENQAKRFLKDDRAFFELVINKNEAEIQFFPNMQSDDFSYPLPLLLATSEFYFRDDKVYQVSEINNETYFKAFDDELEWKFYDENKNILGFECHKATATVKTPGDSLEVIAWYCPEISAPFGPNRFNNLPGLIMGLTYRGRYYYATKINTKKTKEIIEFNTENVLNKDENFIQKRTQSK